MTGRLFMFPRRGPTYTDHGSDAPRQRLRAKWWLTTGALVVSIPDLRALSPLVRQHRPRETILQSCATLRAPVDLRECGIRSMAACGRCGRI